MINRFEDIKAWEKAKELTILVFRHFNNCRNYCLRDQIQRAAISIMNNIAEGYERKGDREFKRFLFIAKGSCGEVRSMLLLSSELDYIQKEKFEKLYNLSLEISKILSGFIKKLN